MSIDDEKTFDKFMIKTLNELGIEGNFLNLVGASVKNPQLTTYLIVKD